MADKKNRDDMQRKDQQPERTETREPSDQNQQQQYRALTHEELRQIAGEELPERAAMSLINANLAIPINLGAALNVLSDGSVAGAQATQNTPITQGNVK